MSQKRIDLNQWELSDGEIDVEGYDTLKIIPKKLEDGTQLPPMFFIKETKPYIEDVDKAVWFKGCEISSKGTIEEYAKRVDWWVENAMKDEEYKKVLNDTFNKNGFNVKLSWDKAWNKLKSYTPSKRKTKLCTYIWNWLSKGMGWRLDDISKGKV